MGLKLLATVVVLLAMWIGYPWIDRFDPAMVRGKRVLVTGASKGIGEQLAYQYAGMGAKVMVTARSENSLKKVVAKCKELSRHPDQYYVTGDMSKLEDAEKVMDAVKEKLGGLDILVLNHVAPYEAAWWQGKENLTVFNYKTTVDYLSYVHLAANALSMLRERPGSSIVVVSSILGAIVHPAMNEYSASKFALRGFFQGLGEQFKITGQDTSVTICFLGVIDTDSARQLFEMRSVIGKNLSTTTNAIWYNDIIQTATAIMKAGALREETMFFPSYFKVIELPVLHSLLRYYARSRCTKGWTETKTEWTKSPK